LPKILAFPQDNFYHWSGVVPATMFRFVQMCRESNFHEKSEIESDLELLQPVTYVLIRNEKGEVLTYVRSKKQKEGEKRLLGQRSIGFGGHVELQDLQNAIQRDARNSQHADLKPQTQMISALELLHTCVHRELKEELGVEGIIQDGPQGYIRDVGNEVGLVHVGAVYFASVKSDVKFTPSEEVAELRWMSPKALSCNVPSMEPWSKILMYSFNIWPKLPA